MTSEAGKGVQGAEDLNWYSKWKNGIEKEFEVPMFKMELILVQCAKSAQIHKKPLHTGPFLTPS